MSKKNITPANRSNGHKPGTWPKGVSGNPKGAPKRGESWAEIIKAIGDMTPAEATRASKTFTLKQAAVLAAYRDLIYSPDGRLLNSLMDRAEGKPVQPTVSMTWQEWLKQNGYDPASVFERLVQNAATALQRSDDRRLESGGGDAPAVATDRPPGTDSAAG